MIIKNRMRDIVIPFHYLLKGPKGVYIYLHKEYTRQKTELKCYLHKD